MVRLSVCIMVMVGTFSGNLLVADEFHRCAPSISGQYIVAFDPDFPRGADGARVSRDAIRATAQNLEAQYGGLVKHVYDSALRGYAVEEMSESAARALASHRGIAYVEEDCLYRVSGSQAGAPWDLDRIDERSLLDMDGTYLYNRTGWNVHAYVLDFLVLESHEEFGGRVLSSVNCIEADSSGNCTSVYPGRWPISGHGTAVASMIGGETVGAAKNIKLHSVEVCSYDGCPASRLIAGVNWVVNNHIKPAIASISINFRQVNTCDRGYTYEEAFAVRSAIDSAISQGITFTISAGNCDDDSCWYPPANTSAAIVVAYTDSSDWRSDKQIGGTAPILGSNYGSCIDLFAPGEDVPVAWTGSTSDLETVTGSSFAAPLAAGVAALYLEAHPSKTPAEVAAWLVSWTTKNVVTDPMGSPNRLLFQPTH